MNEKINELNALSNTIVLPLIEKLHEKDGSHDLALELYNALTALAETEYIVETCTMLEAISTLSDLDVPPFETYIKADKDKSDFIAALIEGLYDILSDVLK